MSVGFHPAAARRNRTAWLRESAEERETKNERHSTFGPSRPQHHQLD